MPSDRISPEEVSAMSRLGERIVILDCRNPNAWNESDEKIPRAIRMRPDEVQTRQHELDRNATIVSYCT